MLWGSINYWVIDIIDQPQPKVSGDIIFGIDATITSAAYHLPRYYK